MAVPSISERPLALRGWWCAFLVGCGAFYLVAFWPGLLSYDSLMQIQQGRAAQYSDWHPPLMAWLVSLMDQGYLGGRIPTLLVITTYMLSWWLVSWKVSAGSRGRGVLLLLGALVLWPPYWALLGVLWKDVWMAVVLLVTVALLLVLERHPWWGFLTVFAGCLFAAALRYNGIVATLPLLAGLSVALLKSVGWQRAWRWGVVIVILIAHVGSLLVLNRGLQAALQVRKQYPVQAILWHDIVGVSVREEQNLLQVPPANELSLQRLQELYTPDEVVPIFYPEALSLAESWEEVQLLIANWFSVVRDYPWLYIKHRAQVFLHQFSLSGTGVCYPFHTGVESNEMGLAYDPGLSGQFVFSLLSRLTPLFSGWIYLLLCLMVSIACLLVPRQTKQPGGVPPVPVFPLAISASGALYGLAYFFVSTTCDYRMNYWVALAAGLAMVLLVLDNRSIGQGANKPNKPLGYA